MTAAPAPAPERRDESWGAALLPLLDHVAPADPVRAVSRARNWCAIAAGGVWLLPKAGHFATDDAAAIHRTCAAFAVAAVAAHVVRRRVWSEFAAGGATVAAALASGWGRWPAGIAAIVVLSLLLSIVRRRVAPLDAEPDARLPGLGGLAWNVVGVLIVREFVLLPIHVPTGSMEPTIYGNRVHAMGDHLLVDRTAYLVGDPQRFDIAVFDFPLHRPTTFVKRVIALPLETVEIRDGDVWIDGRIPAKPPLVQEQLWRELFPRPNPRAQVLTFGAAWRAADRATGGGWNVEGDGVTCKTPKARETVLRYTRSLTDADLRVRFALSFDGSVAGVVRITSRGHVAELVVPSPAASAPATLTVEGAPPLTLTAGLPDEFAVVDGAAVVRSRGRELARVPVHVVGTTRNGIELAVRDAGSGPGKGAVTFRRLGVDRDIRWRPARDGTATWTVPAGAYFVLGDHAENSEDSREWRVTELDVRGRDAPLRAAAEYPSDLGVPVRNLARQDGVWTFHDVDGVARSVAAEDVLGRRDGVPVPFVPRAHFLGRARLIFWPWPAEEGGFRPRLLP